MRNENSRQRGFTLIELLVVLAIVALLASLVGPTLYQKLRPARSTAAKVQIQNISKALDAFFIDNGRFPSTAEGLSALREKPSWSKNWKGPYLEREVPLDPWGRAFFYKAPGRSSGYELLSYGSDGKEGGEDDDADVSNL